MFRRALQGFAGHLQILANQFCGLRTSFSEDFRRHAMLAFSARSAIQDDPRQPLDLLLSRSWRYRVV